MEGRGKYHKEIIMFMLIINYESIVCLLLSFRKFINFLEHLFVNNYLLLRKVISN